MSISSPNRRVLVVDDDSEIRQLMALALRKRKIAVDVASDGKNALNRLQHAVYHGLIADLRMPGMNGHELCSRVLEMGEPRCIVVVTALREPKIVQDLLARGVDAVELKPLDFQVLAAMIEAYIDRRYAIPESTDSSEMTGTLGRTVDLLKRQLNSLQEDFDRSIQKMEKEKHHLQEEFFDTVQVFSKMMSQTGEFSSSHASRVEHMAAYIGERAGMSAVGLRHLRLAGMMHDIGQFGMPDSIITKAPRMMTEKELDTFRRYPVLGAMLLKQTPNGGPIAKLIETHRENFDGTGFPEGLSGDKIPLGARALRIADSTDNLIMHTTENPKERCLRHLHEQAGLKFDPSLVQYARQYIDSTGRFECVQSVSVAVSDLRPGMVLAEHAYNDDGQFLACEGTELNPRLIHRLAEIMHTGGVRVIANNAGGSKAEDHD